MLNVDQRGLLYRSIAAISGVAMVGMGVAPIVRTGDLSYTNWFGGLVFAPIAILFGVFTVFCAIFKPDWLAAPAFRKR